MDVTYQKDVCFFVGGVGAKTGVPRAGGCTKAWLAAQGVPSLEKQWVSIRYPDGPKKKSG